MTQPTEVSQMLVAGGSAVVGGLITGGFALLAGWKQGNRQRREESRRAAGRMLVALSQMVGAASELAQSNNREGVRNAFNNFSTVVTSEGPFISDNEVMQRVRAHIDLMYAIVSVARANVVFPIKVVSRHSNLVVRSVEAYIRGGRLPPYSKPPLRDGAALLAWGDEED